MHLLNHLIVFFIIFLLVLLFNIEPRKGLGVFVRSVVHMLKYKKNRYFFWFDYPGELRIFILLSATIVRFWDLIFRLRLIKLDNLWLGRRLRFEVWWIPSIIHMEGEGKTSGSTFCISFFYTQKVILQFVKIFTYYRTRRKCLELGLVITHNLIINEITLKVQFQILDLS